MTEDKMSDLIKEMNILMKKYQPEGVVLLMGTKKNDQTYDESIFIYGGAPYLEQLLVTAMARNPELHEIIDNVAIAVAVVKDMRKKKAKRRN